MFWIFFCKQTVGHSCIFDYTVTVKFLDIKFISNWISRFKRNFNTLQICQGYMPKQLQWTLWRDRLRKCMISNNTVMCVKYVRKNTKLPVAFRDICQTHINGTSHICQYKKKSLPKLTMLEFTVPHSWNMPFYWGKQLIHTRWEMVIVF